MRAPMPSGTAPRSRVVLACLCMLSASPALARAQVDARPVARTTLDARLAARLDTATLGQIAQLMADASLRRLPVEPLVDKALEGASKGAPGPRIVDAVRRLSSDLAQSRRILGADATDAEVTAGAHALRAKLAPESLERMRRKRGGTPIIAALGVYQELVALRVPADTAAAAVVSLHQVGVSAERLPAFQHDVARDIAVGGSPGMVAAQATGIMVGDGGTTLTANLPGTFVETRNLNDGNRPPKRKP